MPRSRGAEMPQKQSPRGVLQLKTSSSNSDPLHNRPITNRSPKIGDRRSSRGVTSDSMSQKKLGTRIAGLESQLDQAQEELKILKEQLASVEAAKKEAQQELEKNTTKHSHPTETGQFDKKELKILKEQLALVEAAKKEAQQELEKNTTKHSHPTETGQFDKKELKILKEQLASVEAAKKEAQQELEKNTTKHSHPTETGQFDKKELKILKEQLASVEAAKKEAQQEQEKKNTTKHSHPTETGQFDKKDGITPHEIPNDHHKETDVFEVPVEKVTAEPKVEFSQQTNEDELKTEPVGISVESPAILEQENPSFDDLAQKNDEINSLKATVEEKEKELEVFCQENESLKSQLNEATLEISSARVKEREMNLRLNQLGEEVEASKGNVVELNEKIEGVERAKEALENEMKKLRVQTEQWRKAADAAAAVLAGNVERCGSMEKHFGSVFDPPVGGYAGFVGSPGLGDDTDDGFGGGKRKSSGIRMFGDLWKKKGQK